MEEYEGYQIVWNDPPASQNMWDVQIGTEDYGLQNQLDKYIRQNGRFHSPVGPLDNARAAARKYIDAILAYPVG